MWLSNSTPKYILRRMKTGIQTDTYMTMFTASLFPRAKRWKQPQCPSSNEQINKLCRVCVICIIYILHVIYIYVCVCVYTHTHNRIVCRHKKEWSSDTCCNTVNLQNIMLPWQVWLSRLSAHLQTERSLVQFPVKAHAWVMGQVPSWGRARGNQWMFLSLIDVSLSFSSLPLSLKIDK